MRTIENVQFQNKSLENFTVAIYVGQFPPRLKVGGGCALRYFTITKNLLADGVKVILFSPCTEEEILCFSSFLRPYVKRGKLVIVALPTMKNQIYTELEITNATSQVLWNYYKIIREHRVQLLLCPDNGESALVLQLSKLAGVPSTVYGVHTDLIKMISARQTFFDIKNWICLALIACHHTICSAVADQTAVSSEAFRHQIADRLPYQLVQIHETFESQLWSSEFKPPKEDDADVAHWRNILSQGSPDSPLLLYAGRWSVEKRIHMIPPVVPKGWKLAIVGDGHSEDALQILELYNENVYVHKEFFPAEVLCKIYAAADFLISASDFETFGFVALESIACGTPVAVQASGGFLQNIEDGFNGLLLQFSDPEECKSRLEDYHPASTNYSKLLTRVLQQSNQLTTQTNSSYSRRFITRHAPQIMQTRQKGEMTRLSVLRSQVYSGVLTVWRCLFIIFYFSFYCLSKQLLC